MLDIGTSAVRLCELVQTKTGFQLAKYYQREFNTDPALSEEERQANVLETITDLVKESKNRARRVNFGVPLQSVFTRKRALPPVPEHKVPQIVRYEIQQQIPFSLDQIALDYQVLDRTEAGGYDVLMAAVKVDVVDKRTEIIRKLKRSIGVVDVSPIAAYNWLKYTGEFGEEGECVALIDLGASTTDIVIEREGQLQFPRSLNLGGNDITAAISSAFGMTFPEAEQLKRQKGFAPTGDPQRDGRGGEVIGGVLNRLIAEINRTLAYFRSQPGGGPVSRVVVTGGGSCLRNIIPFLQRQLGMEVRIAQPLAGLAIGPGAQDVNEHPEQAAVALGLALRAVGDVSISLSLIPPAIRQQAELRRQYLYWGLIALSSLLVMASIVPDIQNRNRMIEERIDKAESVIHAFDPEATVWSAAGTGHADRLKQLKILVRKFDAVIGRIDDAYEKRQSWLTFLKAVTDSRPKDKGIWVSSFSSVTLTLESSASDEGGGRGGRGGRPGAAPSAGAGLRNLGNRGNSNAATGGAATGDAATGNAATGGAATGNAATGNAATGGAATGGAATGGAGRRGANAAMAPEPRNVVVTPFPGISSGASSSRPTASPGRGRSGGLGRGARSGRNAALAGGPRNAAPYLFPNAITITGYAQDEEALMAFRERLNEQECVKATFFNQSSVQVVPAESLGAFYDTRLASQLAGGQTIMTFKINVQISGQALVEVK